MKNKLFKVNISEEEVRNEGFLPMLLASVSLFLTLLAAVIDKFIYPFGGDMLSPAIAQIIILLIPAYLCVMLTSYGRSSFEQIKSLGIGKLHAEYIFFMIFTAMFTITTSLLLDMVFCGVVPSSSGFTLFAAFTAGVGEYTVSYPYIILVYAIFPAIVEEFMFRGVIFSELRKISVPFAICVSSPLYALFSFAPSRLPSALFVGSVYCFILMTSNSLQSCMIVHFFYNIFSLFWGTNISAYFLSSQSRALLIITVIAAWLISASLFFAESSRIYRTKSAKSSANSFDFIKVFRIRNIWQDSLSTFSFKPTLICGIACIVLYMAIMIICLFA